MNADLNTLFDQVWQQAEGMKPINAKMKLVMDEHLFVIDGTGDRNLISQKDTDTNCTIRTDIGTFIKMKTGKLKPVKALLLGKIAIDGDMGLAFRLKSLLG